MNDKLQTQPESVEFLLYQTEDGQTRLEVAFRGETCWLSLNQLAELFQRDKSVISRHIENLFDEGELVRGSVVANFATTAADGKRYQVDYFNLDVIISVGYRVKSHRSTQFRIWATQRLREFIRIVNAYLEFAELQALNRKPIYMGDWIAKLDDFLKLSGQQLLTHAGAISHEQALERAQIEYEKHRALQINQPSPVEKHFDQAVKKLPKSGTGSREGAKRSKKR